MRIIHKWLELLMLICILPLSACSTRTGGSEKIQPVMLEAIEGSEQKRVLITGKAAERIDLQTAEVEEELVDGTNRLVVPYAAVIYDVQGDTWLYTSPSLFTFVRESITVDFIDGDTAVLVTGPSVGTEVVTVGVAELYGAETGVSK